MTNSIALEIKPGDIWSDRFGDTMVVVKVDPMTVVARYPDKNWGLTFSKYVFSREYSRLVSRKT